MSKFVDEIVKDIRTNPKTWSRFLNSGLQKAETHISNCGNGSKYFFLWATSIASVTIDGIRINSSQLSSVDKYKLEEAFIWWFKNADVEMLKGKLADKGY